MATKTTRADQDIAGRRIPKKGEAPKANLADKIVTPVIDDLVAYIKEQTGYEADPMSVQLGSVLRGDFQKSEGNQTRIAQRKLELEAEAEARAQRAIDRAAAKEARAAARAAKAAEPKAEKVAKAPAAKPAAKATAVAGKKPVAKAAAKPVAKAAAAAPAARRRPVRPAGEQKDF